MLHIQTMKNEVTYRSASRRTLSLAIAAALIGIAGGFVSQTAAQKPSKSDKMAKFAQGSNDAANAKFQGGRDLISDEQYAKAIEKFSEYISEYPKEKNIDAALYWKAYSEYKLSKFDRCKSTIDQLLKSYEKSSWKNDARTLLAQIPGGSGTSTSTGTGVGVGGGTGRAADLRTTIIQATQAADSVQVGSSLRDAERALAEVEATLASAQLYRLGNADFYDLGRSNAPDDDPCEFKIVVLQALFQSDVQRGIAAASDWLKPGSTQTPRCKSAALTLLARNGGKSVTPIILGVAQNETDLKLRAHAISVLGRTNDESVIDPLRDFALNSQQSEIAEASLYALSEITSPRAITVLSEIATSNKPVALRRMAILSIANRQGDPALDALFKIYDADQNLEIRKSVIAGLARRRSERAGSRLLEIARGADNIELRKSAISSIARRGGDQAIDTLLNLYDTEKSEELKDQIINSLGYGALAVGANGISYPSDQRVTRKLIEIAKNPQTPIERRKRAIGMLSRSKDPEVLKFLEDLLK
ncbi:MAG TPA: HEAT repeat domain-containing protein [Pyrinomonadaceae bacterium]|nr:HEAT repeat domain-containing protein [Pyrinomonadaceae bacterium]